MDYITAPIAIYRVYTWSKALPIVFWRLYLTTVLGAIIIEFSEKNIAVFVVIRCYFDRVLGPFWAL